MSNDKKRKNKTQRKQKQRKEDTLARECEYVSVCLCGMIAKEDIALAYFETEINDPGS